VVRIRRSCKASAVNRGKNNLHMPPSGSAGTGKLWNKKMFARATV